MSIPNHNEANYLADQLERSFHGGAWHGPATREVLAGIDAATAAKRPPGSPNSIFEIVRHLTFWFYAAYLRIVEGRDVDPGEDWKESGELTDVTWLKAVKELEQAHSKLHSGLADFGDDRLDDTVAGTDPTVRGLLLGTLQHTAYHTGQIVQLKRELVS